MTEYVYIVGSLGNILGVFKYYDDAMNYFIRRIDKHKFYCDENGDYEHDEYDDVYRCECDDMFIHIHRYDLRDHDINSSDDE